MPIDQFVIANNNSQTACAEVQKNTSAYGELNKSLHFSVKAGE
jgi:hypothetical protein